MTQWPLALLLALSSKQNLIAGGQTHTLLLSDMCVCVCAFANNSGKDNNDADSMAKSMWTAQQMQAAVYSAVGDLISIRPQQQWDHLRVDVQTSSQRSGWSLSSNQSHSSTPDWENHYFMQLSVHGGFVRMKLDWDTYLWSLSLQIYSLDSMFFSPDGSAIVKLSQVYQ